MNFLKDPNAVLDFAVDWSKWLAEGETISAAEVTITPAGLTKDSQAIADGKVTAWLSGGVDNASYKATCHITTSQGRQDDRTFTVSVRQR